jgi:hypothetical protein
MTFDETVIATAIGSLIGFIFAICLFYITEYWKEKSREIRLEKSAKKELSYNILLFNQQFGVLNNIIDDVASNNITTDKTYGYKNFQSGLLGIYYSSGYATDKLSPTDILFLSTIQDHVYNTQHINDDVDTWKNGGENLTVSQTLIKERDIVSGMVRAYQDIVNKL